MWKPCADMKVLPVIEESRKKRKIVIFPRKSSLPDLLPQAIPRVDLAIIQVILFAGVEHKLSFMGAVFLWENNTRQEIQVNLLRQTFSEDRAGRRWVIKQFLHLWEEPWELRKKCLCVRHQGVPQFIPTRLLHNRASVIDRRTQKWGGCLYLRTNYCLYVKGCNSLPSLTINLCSP